jgi:hypothetical protein
LKHDNAVRKPVGSDNFGHSGLVKGGRRTPARLQEPLTYLTAKIYMSYCIT